MEGKPWLPGVSPISIVPWAGMTNVHHSPCFYAQMQSANILSWERTGGGGPYTCVQLVNQVTYTVVGEADLIGGQVLIQPLEI